MTYQLDCLFLKDKKDETKYKKMKDKIGLQHAFSMNSNLGSLGEETI